MIDYSILVGRMFIESFDHIKISHSVMMALLEILVQEHK